MVLKKEDIALNRYARFSPIWTREWESSRVVFFLPFKDQNALAVELIKRYSKQIDDYKRKRNEKINEARERHEEMGFFQGFLSTTYSGQHKTKKGIEKILQAEEAYKKAPFFSRFTFLLKPVDWFVTPFVAVYNIFKSGDIEEGLKKTETNLVSGSVLRNLSLSSSTNVLQTFSVIAALSTAAMALFPALVGSVGAFLGSLVFFVSAASGAAGYALAKFFGLGHWSSMLIALICFVITFYAFKSLAKKYKESKKRRAEKKERKKMEHSDVLPRLRAMIGAKSSTKKHKVHE